MVDRVEKPYKDNRKKDNGKSDERNSIGFPRSKIRGLIDDLIH